MLCSVTFFRKWCGLWSNVEKYSRGRQVTNDKIIRRMRVACWITNATPTHTHTHTHSDCVIFFYFPWQNTQANTPQYYVYTYTVFAVLLYCVTFLSKVHKSRILWNLYVSSVSCLRQSDITIKDLQPVTLLPLYLNIFSSDKCFSESRGVTHGEGMHSSLKCHKTRYSIACKISFTSFLKAFCCVNINGCFFSTHIFSVKEICTRE